MPGVTFANCDYHFLMVYPVAYLASFHHQNCSREWGFCSLCLCNKNCRSIKGVKRTESSLKIILGGAFCCCFFDLFLRNTRRGSGLALWLVVVALSARGSRTTEQPAVFSKEPLISCCLSPERPALQSQLLVPSLLDPGGFSWQCLLSGSRCSSGLSCRPLALVVSA